MSTDTLLDEDIARLNDQHPDTVTFVARHLIPASEVTSAWIEAVTLDGLRLQVKDRTGWMTAVVPLTGTSVEERRSALYGLVTQARAVAGPDEPLTSVEVEIAEATGLPTVSGTVVAATAVNRRFRQLTFAVETFTPLGPDQFLLVTPDIIAPPSAYYTVRRWRPGEIDVWFLRHDHPATVAEWAMQAQVGSRANLWGPRRSYRPPAGIDHLLLVADETGLPAVAAILEQRDADQRASVFVQVDAFADRVDLEIGEDDSIEWIPRTDGELVDRVARLEFDPIRTYAFGGAESRQITRVRSYLRRQVGMERTHVQMTGYWRASRPADR